MSSGGDSASIVVTDVRTDGQRVEYDYRPSPGVRRFFAEDLAVEYGVDVSEVPESLLVIPLVANLCPVAWATGADVYVPEIDGTFLRALTNVREAFERLHPEFAEDATVYAKQIVENGADTSREEARSGLLFSGGVDSVASYVRHRDENPLLVSIHGFDIPAEATDQWAERRAELRAFSDDRGLDHRFVRMNMQSSLNLVMLNAHFGRFYDDNWITSVHHGLGLLGACAPLAEVEDVRTLYIAATHSAEFDHEWGSHPATDGEVAWADTTVEHDAYEWTRQQKLFRIAEYVENEAPNLQLRTCSAVAGNCSRCEKCARTEAGLLLAGLDPANHGYDFDGQTLEYVREQFEAGNWHLGADERFMWRDIQNHADPERAYPYPEATNFFRWLRDADIGALAVRSTNADSTDSVRNRALYAVARHTPAGVYSPLYSAYSYLDDRLSG